VFERSENCPKDRESERALGLESSEGNGPPGEGTTRIHGGKHNNMASKDGRTRENTRIAAACRNSCQTNRPREPGW